MNQQSFELGAKAMRDEVIRALHKMTEGEDVFDDDRRTIVRCIFQAVQLSPVNVAMRPLEELSKAELIAMIRKRDMDPTQRPTVGGYFHGRTVGTRQRNII